MNNQMKHSPLSSLSRFISSAQSMPLIITVILILFIGSFLFVPAISHVISHPQKSIPETPTLLPGQQIWKNGVSSYLFGTNDTQEWIANNVETNPTEQQALNNAHFTLMRTFFFDKSLLDGHPTTDAEIEQRLKTVENSGMNCLGVLESVYDPVFVKHVVTYAGNRCNLYEFGNEPDNSSQLNMQEYIQDWNSVVPQLRKINPHAKFIGPAVADYTQVQVFLENVKASGVLPDAISFHWYPCAGSDTASSCLAKTSTFEQVTTQVKKWVQDILGQNLPVGITEWNYNADNPPTSYGQDPMFITQFSISALDSMIRSGLNFANQFDAASDAGSGGLDMFDLMTHQPKPQYYAIKSLIDRYMPSEFTFTDNYSTGFSFPSINFCR
jgi:hypothetical protein